MRFGATPVADAAGAVLVHTVRAGARVWKKGRVLAAADCAALAAAGVRELVCARVEPGELGEDAAAAAIAAALAGAGVTVDAARTGRANLRAAAGGLARVDAAAIARANAIDEAITIATVAADAPVAAGALIATVKIIPFAAAAAAVDAAAAASRGAVAVAPWRGARAGLVLTRFADTAPALLARAAAAQRTRLARAGGALVREVTVAHEVAAVAGALAEHAAAGLDPILALGASAIMDRRDVIPAAIVRAGGALVRFGMPVDPGNLILVGTLGAATVIGVPGCARSLARSGFDWVLERACAGVAIAAADLAALGVGGLLDEAARPSPREGAGAADAASSDDDASAGPDAPPTVAAIVLAAGRGSRLGGGKLLADVGGAPLVRHAVAAACASRARPVVVVTGDRADDVRAACAGLDVAFAHNPDFATGLASSLRVGLAAAGAAGAVVGALVCLGDMPRVTAAHLDALIAAFDDDPAGGAAIVVPTCARKRGNPVLWGRAHFAEMSALAGDVGARALIDRHADLVRWLAVDDPAILVDVDTPEALAAARAGAAPTDKE